MKFFLTAITIMAILALSVAAMAQTATSTFNVTASVAKNCRITSTTDVNFGAYDPTVATPTDASGSMTFRCVKNTTYWLYIQGTRSMVGGTSSDNLNFELYSDTYGGTVFPSAQSGAGTSAPSNAPITQTIYGRIAALQDVSVDNYTRTMTATVEY